MKGILMKPDMIQATIEGRKTHTRRAEAGLKEINREPDKWELIRRNNDGRFLFWKKSEYASLKFEDPRNIALIKPRYHAGETVYIKEAWKVDKRFDNSPPRDLPSGLPLVYPFGGDPADEIQIPGCYGRLRSPLHLREEDARHFIKILAVRAEGLQEIALGGIRAEGITVSVHSSLNEAMDICAKAFNQFRELWNSINPKYPYKSNPWVFPYDFEFLKAGK